LEPNHKVSSPELLKESEATQMMLEHQFIYEIETLYEYQHPNICALIGHSTDGEDMLHGGEAAAAAKGGQGRGAGGGAGG
jgi:hypothetical protein